MGPSPPLPTPILGVGSLRLRHSVWPLSAVVGPDLWIQSLATALPLQGWFLAARPPLTGHCPGQHCWPTHLRRSGVESTPSLKHLQLLLHHKCWRGLFGVTSCQPAVHWASQTDGWAWVVLIHPHPQAAYYPSPHQITTKSKMKCSSGVLTQLKRPHARVVPRNNQCEMSTERHFVCSILGCWSEFTMSEGNAPNSPNIYIIGNKGVGKSSDSEGGQPQLAAVHPRLWLHTSVLYNVHCTLNSVQCPVDCTVRWLMLQCGRSLSPPEVEPQALHF